MNIINVFLDTDVIISALLSSSGAAHALIHSDRIVKYVSDVSHKEAENVCMRLGIHTHKLSGLTQYLQQVKISVDEIASCEIYVHDTADVHILAGAVRANTQFLATYNLRDYKQDLVRSELGIYVYTPGVILQYLRSRE